MGYSNLSIGTTRSGTSHSRSAVVLANSYHQRDALQEHMRQEEEATQYRAIVARLKYMAPDRADIQFAVKESARAMAHPSKKNWRAVVRIGKYLVGKPRLIMKFD